MDNMLLKKIRDAYVVCQDCGILYGAGMRDGRKQFSISTWHTAACDICDEVKGVTEFRDFGYMHPRYVEKSK